MANNNPDMSGLKSFTPETASEAGKKSKRGPSLVRVLKEKLAENPEIETNLMDALVLHATDGSPAHMKMLLEYIDGKVVDKIEQTTKIDTTTPIKIEFE